MRKDAVDFISRCNEGKVPLWFESLVAEGERGWLFANDFNGLFELNLKTLEASYLGSLPNEDLLKWKLSFCLVKVNNVLVIVPYDAKEINLYNLVTNEFRTIELPDANHNFFGAISFGEKVFMFGDNAPVIAVLNLNDESVVYLEEFEKHKNSRIRIPGRMAFRKGVCISGEHLYCVSCDDNELYRIDPHDYSIDYFEIPHAENGLRNIAFDGKNFWITEWENAALISWNEKDNTIEKYICEPYRNVTYRSGDIICNDGIWLFPNDGNAKDDVIVFSKETNEWVIPEELKPYGSNAKTRNDPWTQIFPVNIQCRDSFISYAANTNELLIIADKRVVMSKRLIAKIEKKTLLSWIEKENREHILNEKELELGKYLDLIW